jgi:hypothetical protein
LRLVDHSSLLLMFLLALHVDHMHVSSLHHLVQFLPFPRCVVLYLYRVDPIRYLEPPGGVAKCIGRFCGVEVETGPRGGGATGEETGEEGEDE